MNGSEIMQAQQPAADPEGLIKRMSSRNQTETVRRLHDAVIEHRMSLVTEIDHAQAASDAGLSLPPIEVLVFGNALAGTPLMQATPTIGIDLPLKVLVWTDGEGVTWLAYNDPSWLAARHGAPSGTKPILDAMRRLLTVVVDRAAGYYQSEQTSTRCP